MAIGQDKGAMLSVCDGSSVNTDNGPGYDENYESQYDYSYN